MKVKNLLVLGIVIIFAFTTDGCKKSSNTKGNNITLSGTYQASNAMDVSAVIMYTVNGTVTDKSIISGYLQAHNWSSMFVLDSAVIHNNNSTNVINFTSDGKAVGTGFIGVSAASTTYSLIQKTSAGFILQSADSSVYPETDIIQPRAYVLIDEANSINMVGDCHYMPLNNNIDELCYFRQEWPFAITNGQIYLTLFSVGVSAYTPSSATSSSVSSGSAAKDTGGAFNPEVIKELAASDTLVYQTVSVLYSK